MPANAWKNATASASTSDPTTLPIVRSIGWVAALTTRMPAPRRQHQEAEQAVVEEAGEHAGRLEEVERVAARRRVDHDEVEALVVVQQVQRLGRHVLLGAGQGAGDVAVEGVGEDPLGLLGVGGVAPHEAVERRRRVEHHRPQLARAGRLRRARSPAARRPGRRGDRARRRGGGPGRSSRRRPAGRGRPPPTPITAAVVVLPTPPEPQHTMTSAPSSDVVEHGRHVIAPPQRAGEHGRRRRRRARRPAASAGATARGRAARRAGRSRRPARRGGRAGSRRPR